MDNGLIIELKAVLTTQIAMMSNLVDRIDAEGTQAPAPATPLASPEEVIEPFAEGMRLIHGGRETIVDLIDDDTILCKVVQKSLVDGFESRRLHDITIPRASLIQSLPQVGDMLDLGDVMVEVQAIQDGFIYGTDIDNNCAVIHFMS